MKRKTSRQLRPRSQQGQYIKKSPTTLMTLPTELREVIFQYVVVDSDPLPAYVAKRTIKRPAERCVVHEPTLEEQRLRLHAGALSLGTVCEKYMPFLVQQTKAYPEEPPVTQVSRQIREEARNIFYRDNTFTFHLVSCDGGTDDYEYAIGRWFDWTGIANITSRFTISINFMMVAIIGPVQRAATVVIHSNSEHKLSASFRGALTDECTCALSRRAVETRDPDSDQAVTPTRIVDRSIVHYSNHIMSRWARHWRILGRRWDAVAADHCSDCGKVCAPPSDD